MHNHIVRRMGIMEETLRRLRRHSFYVRTQLVCSDVLVAFFLDGLECLRNRLGCVGDWGLVDVYLGT